MLIGHSLQDRFQLVVERDLIGRVVSADSETNADGPIPILDGRRRFRLEREVPVT